MSQGTILHLFDWNEKFTPPFRCLIHQHFADGRHRFVICGDVDPGLLPPSDDTVVYRSLLRNAPAVIDAMAMAEKIILHGLFNTHLLYILALKPRLLKKCCWVLWGGDLYVHQASRKGLRWKRDEILRRFVISRMGHFATYVRGDYELAKRWYGAEGQYHECILYPSNVYRHPTVGAEANGVVNVQVGNSADPGNNHCDIFKQLEPYREDDLKLYVPLSYGDQSYAAAVVNTGTRMFGDKFVPLTEFMPYEAYCEFLKKIDIAVFAHKRQQGMGNIIKLLGLGKKVYMRSDVTSWQLFKELDVTIFDVRKIELTPLGEDARRANQAKISAYFSESRLHEQWKNLFAS